MAHGRADRIMIGLHDKDGNGLLTIRNDGVGLPAAASRLDGIGLHAMAYRAGLIGGSLELAQNSPGGTVVTCVLPIPTAADEPDDTTDAATHA